MARYTGPRVRISRRFGIPIFGDSKYLERRNYPPGVHGPKAARRKLTDYALGLMEKQKLRYYYGLQERQFRRVYEQALRRRGVTGETMLQILEMRLDNVVYRLGFAPTRPAARQMVTHGHIRVNGRKVTIPSYAVKVGDVIEPKDSDVSRQLVNRGLESSTGRPVPDWVSVNRDALRGVVMRVPTRDEIQPIANEQAVVEFYSR
ncbi:30S ribosomal protein S4 [Limisphaera ngatamarikiensis]|jgi:small subunit ribosomal protein S4|uniref:Small ribosomal subunit protein uS4 n=1 Tax=Limisphaera ngatamarikiensis TaxID=1324935 RepID=A0A6M1RR98_9BACT|nr:30S ribosomal protein S4 [Limisphaera ngatamarikiensis]NGO40079.1 30S ribosomal protein S4 [Limisphaera ngatamarikiensis]